MSLKDGVVQSCGVRFVGFDTPANAANAKESTWFSDASFMLTRASYGMVKAILNKTTVGDAESGKKQTVQPYKTFWIKVASADATKPIKGEAIDGENKGSKMYVTDGIGVMKIYTAFVNKEPIQIGIKFNEDSNDFTLFGEINISDQEFNQVNLCMNELIGKIQEDAEKLDKN